MSQQSFIERIVEKLCIWLAKRLPLRLKRHCLVDIAMRAHERNPNRGIMYMDFDELFDATNHPAPSTESPEETKGRAE